jgi:hypothetical protein
MAVACSQSIAKLWKGRTVLLRSLLAEGHQRAKNKVPYLQTTDAASRSKSGIRSICASSQSDHSRERMLKISLLPGDCRGTLDFDRLRPVIVPVQELHLCVCIFTAFFCTTCLCRLLCCMASGRHSPWTGFVASCSGRRIDIMYCMLGRRDLSLRKCG